MPFLNLGVVAHVDAGKTSLTERLLYDAGAVDRPGRVDDGTTRTDSMDLERRRGITIRAAVTAFDLDDLRVTLVDTPGHPDFIAEVERSLAVLDAAVLVLSAVEGVQPQSVVIWRALRRLGVPTLVVVNKVDRGGADVDAVAAQVRRRLTPHCVTLTEAVRPGAPDVRVARLPLTSRSVVEALADVDDAVLDAWARETSPDAEEITRSLGRAVRDGRLTPVMHASALTGAGMTPLLETLPLLVAPDATATDLGGQVFAVDREGGRRRTWIRLWAGTLAVRDRLESGLVTSLQVAQPEGLTDVRRVSAGQIACASGLTARIGDPVGTPPGRRRHRFPPATMQAVVTPDDPAQRGALFTALTELADEDPLIDLHLDQTDGEALIALHGEVQREVIDALLRQRYGIAARFSATTVVCQERVVGSGRAREVIQTDGNPYLATLGLRVDPGPEDSGVVFDAGVEPGRLLPAFIAATEEGVRLALRQGLAGWAVTDARVTMTDSVYWPRQSRPHQGFDKSMSTVAGDFRSLAQVVVTAALARAGTQVCEPVDRVDIEVVDRFVDPVVSMLGRLGGGVSEAQAHGEYLLLGGHLPSRQVPELGRALPGLTGGEGVLVTRPDHFAAVSGDPPRRARSRPDPRHREAFFRDVPR